MYAMYQYCRVDIENVRCTLSGRELFPTRNKGYPNGKPVDERNKGLAPVRCRVENNIVIRMIHRTRINGSAV